MLATTLIERTKSARRAQLYLAREDFPTFRRVVRPDMLWGWWVERLALELQGFYERMRRGERPKLAIMAPPQHGKSWAATDFIVWVAGKNPDVKTIFASYSEALGERTNRDVQRILRAPTYQLIFPNTVIGAQGWAGDTRRAGARGAAATKVLSS